MLYRNRLTEPRGANCPSIDKSLFRNQLNVSFPNNATANSTMISGPPTVSKPMIIVFAETDNGSCAIHSPRNGTKNERTKRAPPTYILNGARYFIIPVDPQLVVPAVYDKVCSTLLKAMRLMNFS
ncbi:hypothetical protein BH10CYA1_BH10CYA1_03740 [soil metagenome]